MKNKIIVGTLLIVIGAVLAILGIPFFTLEDRFSSEQIGTALIHLLLLIGGAVFMIGGIVSMVSRNNAGKDFVEPVWPPPSNGGTGDTSDKESDPNTPSEDQ